MKANELIRQHLTEEYPEDVTQELLEAADAEKSEPMSADELLESLDLEED